jgi:hypothetical protein
MQCDEVGAEIEPREFEMCTFELPNFMSKLVKLDAFECEIILQTFKLLKDEGGVRHRLTLEAATTVLH